MNIITVSHFILWRTGQLEEHILGAKRREERFFQIIAMLCSQCCFYGKLMIWHVIKCTIAHYVRRDVNSCKRIFVYQ